jgi:hypothetical protein
MPGPIDHLGELLDLAGLVLSERTVPVRPLVSPTLRTIRPQDSPRVASTV